MPRSSKRTRRGGKGGLLGSCKAKAQSTSQAVVAPSVTPFQKYNTPSPTVRFMKAANDQNNLNNNSNRSMSGGMAVLKLAGVTANPTTAPKRTVTVPSFGTNANGPVGASANAKAIAQQKWNLAEQAKNDSAVSPAKPLGNQSCAAAAGGAKRRRGTRSARGGNRRKHGRVTRKR